MKLRFFVGFLILILIASLTCTIALADVIWTPNDSFFEKEFKNCTYNGRSYMANGVDGLVTVFRTPGSDDMVAEAKNGNVFYVSFTYADQSAEIWGVVEFVFDNAGNVTPEYSYKGQTGWIRMTDLSVIYDYISFAGDHQSEFLPYTGAYEEFKTGDKIVLWSYPGSGVIVREDEMREIGKLFVITQTYTDTENRLWGYVEYYYGMKNVWVCISDPSGAAFEVAQSPAPTSNEILSPTDNKTPVQPSDQTPVFSNGDTLVVQNNQTPMLLVITAAVAAVVIITGVIIVVFWKRAPKNTRK